MAILIIASQNSEKFNYHYLMGWCKEAPVHLRSNNYHLLPFIKNY